MDDLRPGPVAAADSSDEVKLLNPVEVTGKDAGPGETLKSFEDVADLRSRHPGTPNLRRAHGVHQPSYDEY